MTFNFTATQRTRSPTSSTARPSRGRSRSTTRRDGQEEQGQVISNIAKRELSKAGADFGVKRVIDNDIVHWSRTGR